MSNILYVIDGYLSSKDKADVTLELIQQLRKFDGSRKIMLINKFGNSWGIDTQVDFYREYLDGFMVGYPPEEIINSNLYNKPYVYLTDYTILNAWDAGVIEELDDTKMAEVEEYILNYKTDGAINTSKPSAKLVDATNEGRCPHGSWDFLKQEFYLYQEGCRH